MKKPSAFSAAALVAVLTTFSGAALAVDSTNPAPAAAPMSAAASAPATEISKEQAIEMALKAHPGEVTKAYQDSKKGKKTWEVKVKGADGKKWELLGPVKEYRGEDERPFESDWYGMSRVFPHPLTGGLPSPGPPMTGHRSRREAGSRWHNLPPVSSIT